MSMDHTSHSSPVEALALLAAPLAASLGLSLWGVEIAFGPRSLVRVYVDKNEEGGVGIDECASLSRLLGLSLEVEDLFPGAYVLEVSSPGLERVFFTADQLAAYSGNIVDITLKTPDPALPGRKKFRGPLTTDPQEAGSFSLRPDDPALPEHTVLRFAFADLKKASLVHIPPEKPLPGKQKKNSQ